MRAPYGFSATALLLSSLGHVLSLELGPNAPFELAGIKRNAEGFGSQLVALDQEQAALAPDAERHEKNVTMPLLRDRSLELTQRQSCDAGYWYCSNFGRCCPQTDLCCSYGYCIDPGKTCCPQGPCPSGYNCCSASTCSPPGAQCCADGNYCSPGNVCVKLYDTGKIVCCTDLKCTAAVISGTTTILSPSAQTTPAVPSITKPPTTTQVIVDQYYTWYWTVTWWYYSFYYTTIRASSTVTYTTIYSITTYTTTALNSADASSRFAVLSKSLTFTPPASATTLASLFSAAPSQAPSFQTALGTTRGFFQSAPSSSSSTSSATTGRLPAATSAQSGGGGASSASNTVVGWIYLGSATLCGLLMIWL